MTNPTSRSPTGDTTPPTFGECVMICARERGLVEQFDRLTGSSLSLVGTGSPLDRMIDDATNRWETDMARFCAFVYECVWTRGDWRARPIAEDDA
jgi:hypothetical protein